MTWVADKSGANPLDRPYDQYNRANAGDPTGTLTPQYAGEIVLNTTQGQLFRAAGLTSGTWVELYPTR